MSTLGENQKEEKSPQMRHTGHVEFPHQFLVGLHSHINIEIRSYGGARALPIPVCILG